ncbi:acyl-CoA thioester hydrolase/BAAT C-terminal domain-containing protein [Sporosarcina sp. 179-K 8C2 HS]|uniref:acyl-CoA thioesterase/bile acid-CoA:amino acid N-acyltransferase family protein n=1 Tax=Sporosarcina sp. 179-K 8C2 HS TaxID=3142387 RepID=UPI00399F8787
MKGQPRLLIDMELPLIDRSVGIRVVGLSNGQKVTVRFQRKSYWGKTVYYMESHGTYLADEEGIVDLQQASPLEGTYEGVDGMGLFWSMQVQRTEENSEEVFNKLQPQSLAILLESDGKVIDTEVITRKWIANDIMRTPVNGKGVVGTFFYTRNSNPRPTIIVVGGSEGGIYEFPASLLASHGFNVLALGYWGQAPLPKQLIEIPLEYIESAIHWLQSRPDVAKGWLGIHGTSKGGELALLAATHFEDIKAVVSLSGSPVVFCGIVPWTEQKELPPSWTYKGKAIPYARPDSSVEISNRCLAMRKAGENPLRIWYDYLSSDPQITEQATIPVEKINGSVLLISGTDDACFDSVQLNEMAMERLRRSKFEYEYNHLVYKGAGHEMGIPFIPVAANQFTGGTKYDTAQASRDSWQQTIGFFWRSVSEHIVNYEQESDC